MQARLWACGRRVMSTPSFDSHPNSIPTGGGQIVPHFLTGENSKMALTLRPLWSTQSSN